MALTFATLVLKISSYLMRNDADTIAQIPFFISSAEQRCCKEIINIGIESIAVSAFTPQLAMYPKPAEWRTNLSLNFGTGDEFSVSKQIELVTYEFANIYAPNRKILGPPKFYAEYGFYNFLVVPTPDQAYPFEFSYLQMPQALSISNQMNWLTNFAPDVLFKACMLEAVIFVKDFELVDVWTAQYKDALTTINQQDVRRKDDRLTKVGVD